MLREALRFRPDVHGVDDLTDEEFNVALQRVHGYYRMHPAQKGSEGIETNNGPGDVSERRLERAHYVG